MFVSAPFTVLQRTRILRILYCLTLPLLAGFFALGAWAAWADKTPDPTTASIHGGLVLAVLTLLGWLFRREGRLQILLHEEGIVAVEGRKRREVRWEEVEEIWFRAIKIGAGGLVGGLVGAAVEAAASGSGEGLDPNTTQITARLVGRGRKITLTSNYRGVVGAVDEVLRRVNPRLVAECRRRLEQGETVAFGKVALSSAGVRVGAAEVLPFDEIERFAIEGGRLGLKKLGAWRSKRLPIHQVPNVYVLMEAFEVMAYGRTSGAVGVDAWSSEGPRVW